MMNENPAEDDDNFVDPYFRPYDEKQKEYLEDLDFKRLADIRSKDLKDLTEEDLFAIGFRKAEHDEIENLYCYADLNGLKVYIERDGENVSLLGFMLKKIKDIRSTEELLHETLTKWRLKIE